MGIPEMQLETWSRLGAQQTSKETYAAIRRAVEPLKERRTFEVYLQGSYGNDTNVRGSSDVDVVVECSDIVYTDTTALSPAEREQHDRDRAPSSYDARQFRADVHTQLVKYFGAAAVTSSANCLKVARSGDQRLTADVVACCWYRKYLHYPAKGPTDYIDGIQFHRADNDAVVINYPRQHSSNGTQKHQLTGQWFKRTVRMFKNARDKLIDDGKLSPDVAPSYFLESFIYNALNDRFGPSLQDTFVNVVNWLNSYQSYGTLQCQNEVVLLFGTTAQQWREPSARQLLQKLIELWNNW